MTAWPYDPDTRELVAARRLILHAVEGRQQLPESRGEHELRRFLSVLAAPLALIRQNIEELHADLFIDTCGDEAIALLADLVATKLLFPDADANRRDVRGTIAWRRRKGTPVMLEEMARELADELVVLHEGWQHVQLAQDLDILRLERVSADLRPPIVAETSHGPLDRMHHAVDIRAITATTGKYHPRHLVHWRHPSKTWPVSEGTAWKRSESSAGVRFAVHPLGVRSPLLARSTGVDDPLDSDRIPPMHFAARPGDWFDRAGRFTVRVASLPAAIAETETEERGASELPAEHELAEGQVSLTVLDRARDRWTQEAVVSLCVVNIDLVSEIPDTASGVQVRTTLQFDGGGVPNDTPVNTGTVTTTDTVVMIRLTPSTGLGCFFPGATIAIAGGRAAARLASQDQALQLRGYLRGALVVELPPTWIFGTRWFYLAGDGSLVSAQSNGAGEADVALLVDGGQRTLDLDHLAALGPAAAWPARRPTTSVDRIVRLPPTPGRGPVVLHGGVVVEGSSSDVVDVGTACALEFAAARLDAGVFIYEPMVRLSWTGSDPSVATWTALLDAAGTTTSEVDDRFAEIAALRESGASGLRLVVRFVCNESGARMAPSEVAWSAHDGRTYLLHLPQLDADATLPDEWLADGYSHTSVIVEPAEDGSTWLHGGGLGRMAEGSIAPLREYPCHLRRRLRWRKLCPWDKENPPTVVLPPAEPGFLEVDVEHGYFT
ncbi:MAG TPA: hypothetical protein VM869_02125, partial [Enhygromyxa sp.]|nr:hypothetical protein [Enhygromyxa sp.]